MTPLARRLLRLLNTRLAAAGLKLVRRRSDDALMERGIELDAAKRAAHLYERLASRGLGVDIGAAALAQAHQDLFALAASDGRRGGFFVEFGAADGLQWSNTHLLETQFGWRGVLAEPARHWRDALRANRACRLDFRCVWSQSRLSLPFVECDEPELSTVAARRNADDNARNARAVYDVDTVSLIDLLREHDAPRVVDFLSIDAEGSEFDILDAFDFDAFDVRTIVCEHNFTASRARIHALLTSAGYRRVLDDLSGFDDWYVKV